MQTDQYNGHRTLGDLREYRRARQWISGLRYGDRIETHEQAARDQRRGSFDTGGRGGVAVGMPGSMVDAVLTSASGNDPFKV